MPEHKEKPNDTRELGKEFILACRQGELEAVKLLVQEKRAPVETLEYKGFLSACFHGHLSVVQYLLHDSRTPPAQKLIEGFDHACQKGHFHVVQWLVCALDNNELSVAGLNSMHTLEDSKFTPFTSACFNGHKNIIEFLLSYSLMHHPPIFPLWQANALLTSASKGHSGALEQIVQHWLAQPVVDPDNHKKKLDYLDMAFSMACRSNHLSIAQYLLNTGKIALLDEIYEGDSCVFKHVVEHHDWEMTKFLIVDAHIPLSKAIEEYISTKEDIKSLFAKRALEEKLQKDLALATAGKRSKI